MAKQRKVQGIDLNKLERFPLEGFVIQVEDGDTIFLIRGSERITVRLAGIDTPETEHARTGKHPLVHAQRGSGQSIAYLTSVINNYRSQLELFIVPGESTHGRLVGVLVVGKLNVNLAMVRRGLATSYAPEGPSQPGIHMGSFRHAEKRAFAASKGLFSLAQYRAQFALNRAKGDMANVQMASPDRQADSFQARVRARAVKGMRSEDHHENVPHGIQGMQPGRGDFGGGRTPGNPVSLGLLGEQHIAGALKGDDYAMFREALQFLQKEAAGTGGFQFADIETTGLRAMDPITEAAYSRVTAKGAVHYNWAINPRIPTTGDPGDVVTGLGTAYESALNEGVRKRLQYPGSSTLAAIPDEQIANLIPGGQAGQALDFSHVQKMLEKSSFGSAPGQLRQLQSLISEGRVAEMSDVLDMMFGQKAGGRQFMFISNPRFEASKWAPHIADEKFSSMLETGQLAAGSPTYKSVYQQFDVELSQHAEKAFRIERGGNLDADALRKVGKHRAAWYGRLRKLMKSGGGKGTAIVDIQDLSRSVIGMAGVLDPKLATPATGLLSQDVMGRVLGLGAESHLALSDELQSQVVVARLLQMGDKLQAAMKAGDPSMAAQELGRLKNLAPMQKTLGMFSVFRDLGQRVQHMSNLDVPVEKMVATWKGNDLKELVRKGEHYFIGGERIPVADAPKVFYAAAEGAQELGLREYGKRRLMMTVPDITEEQAGRMSQELIDMAVKSPDTVGKYSTGDIYSMIQRGLKDPLDLQPGDYLHTLGARLDAFEGADPRDYPLEKHFEYLTRQLRRGLKSEAKTGAELTEKAAGKTTHEAVDAIADAFSKVPDSVSKWWSGLSPKARRGVGIAGAAAAVLGTLGTVRSVFEEEHAPQPMTQDMEAYFANQQMQAATQYLNQSTDIQSMMANAHYNSQSMIYAQKDPGRYYGGR